MILARHLWAHVATFLTVSEHLTRFARACRIMHEAAQSPSSWYDNLVRDPSIRKMQKVAESECPIKRHLFEHQQLHGDNKARRHIVASGLVSLVTKYNFCPPLLDLSFVYHIPTAIALIEALAQRSKSAVRSGGVQQVVLLVWPRPGFCHVWAALSLLPCLHTLVLTGYSAQKWNVPRGMYIANAGSLDEVIASCDEVLARVKRLLLTHFVIGFLDPYQVLHMRRLLPALEDLHFVGTKHSSMYVSQQTRAAIFGAVADTACEIDDVDDARDMGSALSSCRKLERLSLQTGLPRDMPSLSSSTACWPLLRELELYEWLWRPDTRQHYKPETEVVWLLQCCLDHMPKLQSLVLVRPGAPAVVALSHLLAQRKGATPFSCLHISHCCAPPDIVQFIRNNLAKAGVVVQDNSWHNWPVKDPDGVIARMMSTAPAVCV